MPIKNVKMKISKNKQKNKFFLMSKDQQALHFYLTPHRRPVGRPPLTWLALVTKDLRHTLIHHNIKTPLNKNSIDRLSVIAKDNTAWRREIERSMGSNL